MNTPAIPPPADPHRKSDPPTVKIARGHDAMWQNLGLGVLLTIAFVCRPSFPVEHYIGAMLAGFGVVNLPALFGRRAGSIGGITLALAGGKYVAHAAALYLTRHSGPWIAAALSVLVSGCAAMDLPDAATARIALNKQAEAMNRLGPVLVAACVPEPQPAWCVAAIEAFNDVAAAHGLTQDFVDVYSAVSQ